ncbi:hypothetical protein DICA3_B11012 [Diutina catenulata]
MNTLTSPVLGQEHGDSFTASKGFWEQEYQRSIAYDTAASIVETFRSLMEPRDYTHHSMKELLSLRTAMVDQIPGAKLLFEVDFPQNTQMVHEADYEWVCQCFLQKHDVGSLPIQGWSQSCYIIGLEEELKALLRDVAGFAPHKGSLHQLWNYYIFACVSG